MTQSLNDSISPFSRLHHLPYLAFHQVALQRADMADVELAVQMIRLVEKGAREKVLARLLVPFAIDVVSADNDLLGASDVFAKLRNAQAAFTLRVLPLGVNDLGVGEDELGIGVFFECDINHGQPLGDADLWRGQANALGFVHGLKHVCDQLLETVSELGHRLGRFFQNWVSKLNDGIDHEVVVYGRSLASSRCESIFIPVDPLVRLEVL